MQYEGVIRQIVRRDRQISCLEFSYYCPNWGSDMISDYSSPRRLLGLVGRGRIKLGFIKELEKEDHHTNEEVLGLNSRVWIGDSIHHVHLDMVDFCCEKSEEGLESVRNTLIHLGMRRGFIMDSGNSYHYLGSDFRSEDEYLKLLERMHAFECIGGMWPFQRQLEGFSTLRIIPCPKSEKQMPTLVERFENPQTYFTFVE